MKKGLLALSVLSLGAALSASAAEERYYIIKDGQLADGIVQRPYLPVEEGDYDSLICAQDYDGKTVAAYYHMENYKDVRFDLSEAPLDLSKTWVMTLKYRLPFIADTANYNTYAAIRNCSANDGTKPAFYFGLAIEADSTNMNTMDYAFNVQAAVESFNAEGDWMEKELYLIVPSFLKEAKSFVMGYAREAGARDISNEPAYIEELSFHAAGELPFLAEDFSPKSSNVYSDAGKLSMDGIEWKSGVGFEYGKKTIASNRIWDKPWDDSEIPATEIPHAVKCTKSMGYFTLQGVELPEGASSIAVHVLAKAELTDKNQDVWDALAETSAERPLTVTAIFDDGTETPVFPEYVRKSLWDWAIAEVAVPAGATKFDLKFDASDCEVALLVNQVLVSQASIDLAPYYGKKSGNGVEDFIASVPAAEVYVEDGVVYAADNATGIAVFSMDGALLASAKANSVNISALAAGVYVVRVATADGFAAAIIKK